MRPNAGAVSCHAPGCPCMPGGGAANRIPQSDVHAESQFIAGPLYLRNITPTMSTQSLRPAWIRGLKHAHLGSRGNHVCNHPGKLGDRQVLVRADVIWPAQSGRERGLPITTPPNRPRKGKNDRACHRPGCRSALPPRRHAGSCLRQNSGPAANTARQRQNSGQSSSRSRRPAHKVQQGTRKLALPARTRTWCRWGQNCPDSPPECALARKAAGHKRRRN